MLLRRIHLYGFKSFADPTTIELERGLTVIVGPNGAGKSNLIDAIRWVLAFGSLPELRARRQDELLFQGAPGRPAAHWAEVRLTFEHQGELAFPHAEVTISRRLFRGGESEYRLNGVVVRQRDVSRLFAGTGLGAAGFAIIGQGQVDSVLEASPEERQRMLEEAAGAAAYREERRLALEELAAADEGLRRLRQTIEALTARRPLLQAEVERLDEGERLRRALYEAEVLDLRHRLRQLRVEIGLIERRLSADQARLQRLRAAENTLQPQQEALWAIRQDLQLRLLSVEEQVKRLEILAERRRLRRETLVEKETLLRAEVLRQEERLDQLQRRAEAYRQRLAAAAERLAALGADEPWLDEVADLPLEREGLARRLEMITEELERLEEARHLRRGHDTSLREERQGCEQAARAFRALGERLAGELMRLEAEADRLRTEWQRRQALWQEHQERSLRPPARAVLQAAERGLLSGIAGAIGQLVDVPSEFALAVDVAFGSLFDAIVAECEEDVAQAIAYLRRERIGVATFLPLTTLKPRPAPGPAPAEAVGWLADLVTVAERHRPALEALLGGILVVPTLRHAFRIRQTCKNPPRMVTLEGEQLFPSGSVTGGYVRRVRARSLPDPEEVRRQLEACLSRQKELGVQRQRTETELSATHRRLAELAAVAARLEAEEEAEKRRMDLLQAEARRIRQLLAHWQEWQDIRQQRQERWRLEGQKEEEERALMAVEEERRAVEAELASRRAELATVATLLMEPLPEMAEGRALLQRKEALHAAERQVGRLERLLELQLRELGVERARLEAEVERRTAEVRQKASEEHFLVERLRLEFGADEQGEARPIPESERYALRRAIAELGPARLEARSELTELCRVLEEQTERQAELLMAKDRLLETAARADEALRNRVEQALLRCRTTVRAMVEALFPGGDIEILQRGGGLEIEATLPGKTTKRLALYSGGERSLIALAFLLALRNLSPQPVQILDEADANLDEPNLERLIRFLKSRPDEQFLLISHQRSTMEAADVLVGMVMQEPGVTSVVEVRLQHGDQGDLGAPERESPPNARRDAQGPAAVNRGTGA